MRRKYESLQMQVNSEPENSGASNSKYRLQASSLKQQMAEKIQDTQDLKAQIGSLKVKYITAQEQAKNFRTKFDENIQ